jgi:hypothetical protein
MKSKIPFILIALMLKLSCQNQPSDQKDSADFDGDFTQSHVELTPKSQEKKDGFFKAMFSGGTKTHEFRDARTGIVVVKSEYPADWTVISKPVYTMDQKLPMFLMQVQGPNNLQGFNTPIQFNIDYANPQIRQWMQYNSSLGHLIKPMMSKEQIMQQEVYNKMADQGYTLIGQKKMPRAERYLRKMMGDQGASQTALEHYATEWTNNKGQKGLVTLVTVSMQQPVPALGENMVLWFYSLDYMFVDENQFEKTIDQMLTSSEGSSETAEWKQYRNHLNQVRQQEALRQHRITMNNREAAFNAHQKRMQGISAAQDLNHAAFMNRNFGAGSDTSQRQFINMINEEETVFNPNTGQNYQVNAGSTEYWMDSDHNYIANDNLFYNPNGDLNLNHKEWTKVKKAF